MVAAGAAGWLAGSRIASPAEIAARAEPPPPSLVTVPVERRVLSADIVTRADVGFADPVTLSPAGSTGDPEARQVVTRLPEVGAELVEGAVAVEVAGRPVFLLRGPLPAYRDLRPGAEGADVAQLEAALVRLGLIASADDRWTDETGAALEQLYANAGYPVNAADDEDREALAAARSRVRDAERAVRAAAVAGDPAVSRSAVLQAEATLQSAREAVQLADAQRRQDDAAARAAVVSARAAVEAATAALGAADARDAADAGTVADVAAGGDPAGQDGATLDAERAQARAALVDARSSLTAAEEAVAVTAAAGRAAVAAATRDVTVAEAALVEARRPAGDPGAAGEREAAVEELRLAEEDVARLAAEGGTWLPAGEVAYVPQVPVQVASRDVEPGDVLEGPYLTVSGTATSMRLTLRAPDATRLDVGDEVIVDEPDLASPLSGTISRISGRDGAAGGDGASGDGDPSGGEDTGGEDTRGEDAGGEDAGGEVSDGGDAGSGGGGSPDSRVTVDVALPGVPEALIGTNVRVVIPVESTAGDVLVVPVAALSSVADGDVRVQVEDESATGGTRFVTVVTGLSSDGSVEIRPVDGDLAEGDRVVVGAEGDRVTPDTGDGDPDE